MRERFNTMLNYFNWDLKTVAEITGFRYDYIRAAVTKKRFPRWAKLAIEVFEKMKK